MPSKAAFNYFLVPEGGQGASFSRGAALAPVVAVCQARQPSTMFWFLKGVREPHFPEVQPWLLWWLCAKQGSLQLFFGS